MIVGALPPTALVVATTTAIYSIDASGVIQLTSIIAGAIIVIVAGLFTIRAKNAEWWQQSYEGVKAAHSEEKERADKLQKELTAATAEASALRALPNYGVIVRMMSEANQAQIEANKAHLAAIEKLSQTIEDRLPPIPRRREFDPPGEEGWTQ